MKEKAITLKIKDQFSDEYHEVLMDALDYEKFSDCEIKIWRGNGGLYAKYLKLIDGKKRILALHREILGLKIGDKLYADHINGNSLDNRRSNLRIVTNGENVANRRKKRTVEGFIGIYKKYGKYYPLARSIKGCYFRTEGYSTAEEAAREYDRMYFSKYGKYCHLNFPNEISGDSYGSN